MPDNGEVLVEIYNELGQKMETLVSGFQYSGHYFIDWNADGHSSGVYFYKIKTDGGSAIRKLTHLK